MFQLVNKLSFILHIAAISHCVSLLSHWIVCIISSLVIFVKCFYTIILLFFLLTMTTYFLNIFLKFRKIIEKQRKSRKLVNKDSPIFKNEFVKMTILLSQADCKFVPVLIAVFYHLYSFARCGFAPHRLRRPPAEKKQLRPTSRLLPLR